MNMTHRSRGETAMKRALMIGSTVAIAMMIAASGIRVSARTAIPRKSRRLNSGSSTASRRETPSRIMSCYSMTCSSTMSCRRASTSGPQRFRSPGSLDMFKGPINAEVNDLNDVYAMSAFHPIATELLHYGKWSLSGSTTYSCRLGRRSSNWFLRRSSLRASAAFAAERMAPSAGPRRSS